MISNETVRKLKTLAERGVGGEKDNAGSLLERICKKYNISPDEITSEDKKLRWFRSRQSNPFRQLLFQCIFKTMGTGCSAYRRGRETCSIGVKCTAAQAVEIELDYSFYAKHLEDEISRVVGAFIQVNDIFPPNCPISEKEMDTRDEFMQLSIKKQTRVPQIAQTKIEKEIKKWY